MDNLPVYVNEENAHRRIVEELRAAGFLSAVWMIEDLLRNQAAQLEEKDSEVEGWEEEAADKEREADSAFSELEDVRHELFVMENERDDLENERDALRETLDNVRDCFDALKYHAGLESDQPELVALDEALN